MYAYLAALILGIAIGGTGSWKVQENRYEHTISSMKSKADKEKVEAAADLIVKVNEARADERVTATKYQGALNESRKREAVERANSARLRGESDGLRSQLYSIGGRLSQAPIATVLDYTAAANSVLDDCRRAYEEMAGAATGHAADVRTFIEAWPVAPR